MNREARFNLTEWDWFEVQLQLYALQRRASLFSFFFEFEEADYIVCRMHGTSIEEVLRETAKKEILFGDYFSGWTRSVKRDVARLLKRLPLLSAEFDVEENLVFHIMWDYGMGAELICRIRGEDVLWNEDVIKHFS